MVALSLTVLLASVTLGIDLSFIYNLHTEMQRTVDASALAGASALDDEDDEAYSRTYLYASYNAVNSSPVAPDEVDVSLGYWTGAARTFTVLDPEYPVRPNAVRVVGHRDGIPLLWAPVMGFDVTAVEKEAVATYGSGICAGLWGLEGITGDGDIYTDSYDSQQGPYGSGPIYANGDLCSCQDLELHGSVAIHGDAMYAPDYTLTLSGNSYEIWGVIGTHPCEAPTVEFDIEEVETENDNKDIGLTDHGRNPFPRGPWDLRVNGNDNLTLEPGTYYLTAASVMGHSTITVIGPTEIYVAGDATFAGDGFENVTGNPHNLIIYSVGSTLTVTGTNGFVGAIVAPETDIILPGTGEFWGVILGRTIDIAGTADIHVDESLIEELFDLNPEAPVLVR